MRLLICVPWLAAACLWAHGGVLLLHERAGPYLISLFSADAPVRAGGQDFTVLVEDASDASPVTDRPVKLSFRGSGGYEVGVEGRPAQSTNKLLYDAPMKLAAGTWIVTISVQGTTGAAAASGRVTVLPEQPPIAAYWPYFAVVPGVVLLFVSNRWLKRRSKRRVAERGIGVK